MNLPEDYGLSAAATLAHVSAGVRSRWHGPFWQAWGAACGAVMPQLRGPNASGGGSVRRDASDVGATEEFESYLGVTIGCRVVRPSGAAVRAGLLVLHGYEVEGSLSAEAERWEDVAGRGVVVMLMRVRGYPGSQLETGPLVGKEARWEGPGGYATMGLEAAWARAEDGLVWALARAVMDVAVGWRALEREVGRDVERRGGSMEEGPGAVRVYVRGESFGAGLAVIAAGQMWARGAGPARLVLGHPTLGDWDWRLGEAGGKRGRAWGVQRDVEDVLRANAEREEELRDRLRLMDAAVHAGAVRGTAAVKLAERDDVVPAPSAAAVFNALGCAPGEKWRFVTPTGHFEGGLRHARRQALFERMGEEFVDPAREVRGAMARWEGLLESGERGPKDARGMDYGAEREASN